MNDYTTDQRIAAALTLLHREILGYEGPTVCAECQQNFPCATIRILAANEDDETTEEPEDPFWDDEDEYKIDGVKQSDPFKVDRITGPTLLDWYPTEGVTEVKTIGPIRFAWDTGTPNSPQPWYRTRAGQEKPASTFEANEFGWSSEGAAGDTVGEYIARVKIDRARRITQNISERSDERIFAEEIASVICVCSTHLGNTPRANVIKFADDAIGRVSHWDRVVTPNVRDLVVAVLAEQAGL